MYQFYLKFLHRLSIYFELIDYLKSPNAKKLLVIHFSCTSYLASSKKQLLLLLSDIFSKNLVSFLYSAFSSPEMQANYSIFFDFDILLPIYIPFYLQYCISYSSESNIRFLHKFNASILFLVLPIYFKKFYLI